MSAQIVQVTATGDVTTVTSHLHEVTLTAGSDAATVTVKAGGSSGTTILTLKAAANTSATATMHGAQAAGGVHATLAGTSPVATFVHET